MVVVVGGQGTADLLILCLLAVLLFDLFRLVRLLVTVFFWRLPSAALTRICHVGYSGLVDCIAILLVCGMPAVMILCRQ